MLQSRGLYRTYAKRPDGVTVIPWEMGKQLVWDVTVVDALAPSRLNHGSICNPGTTATEAEAGKIGVGSGRFGTRRFGNKMAEDVSATFCCRNVFGAETSSQQVKDVSATNFQYFPVLMWGHIRCMHARPHRRKDQLPLRSLRDLRFR